MNDHDPPPLDDTPLLREALAAARAEGPDAARLASLAARLPLAAGPPAPASPTAAAPPSVLSGALIGAALGVLVSGAGFLWPAAPEAARSAGVPPLESPPARVVPPAVATGPVEAPRATAVSPPPPASTQPVPRPAYAAEHPPSSAAPSAPPGPSAEPAPHPGDGTGHAEGAPVDAETEVHLLQRAHDALSGSPAQALALTQEHAARFPGGALGQEREVLAIQALLRLGRGDEARARAARFTAAFPGSAHRHRIEALLGP